MRVSEGCFILFEGELEKGGRIHGIHEHPSYQWRSSAFVEPLDSFAAEGDE